MPVQTACPNPSRGLTLHPGCELTLGGSYLGSEEEHGKTIVNNSASHLPPSSNRMEVRNRNDTSTVNLLSHGGCESEWSACLWSQPRRADGDLAWGYLASVPSNVQIPAPPQKGRTAPRAGESTLPPLSREKRVGKDGEMEVLSTTTDVLHISSSAHSFLTAQKAPMS
ncbi:hypothetical protein AAFF_G00131300 [Aldrovandia affinis]|uniref:Uncharacterized protein n=1 Tax=Aldrovandia affinis TaxID=143900 RepID=A0AAD7W9B8_9TELE|nr:hypothetical protein AAFF_G00131300 [Aldrovandia affinis]